MLQPEIAFRRFWVTCTSMREFARAEVHGGKQAPEPSALALGIAVRVMVSEDKVGRVILKLSLNGAQTTKPYQVELELVGEFAARDGSRKAIEQFCRDAGPTLLFPYARQIVDRMTSDGFYGPIRLDPLYLRQMLIEQGWEGNESPRRTAQGGAGGPNVTRRRD